MVYMRPAILAAVKDVVGYYGWKFVFYVHDHYEALVRLEKLQEWLVEGKVGKERVFLHPTRISDFSKCHVTLRSIDKIDPFSHKYIILDLRDDIILSAIFKQLQAVGMNRINYHYLVLSLSVGEVDLRSFSMGGANVTGFQLIHPSSLSSPAPSSLLHTFVKNLKLEEALLVDASMAALIGVHKSFLQGEMDLEGQELIRAIRKVDFLGLSGRVAFDQEGKRTHFKVHVMEMVSDNKVEKIGQWDWKERLVITKHQREEGGGASEMKNRTRIVTTIESKPYFMLKRGVREGDGEEEDKYEGYIVDLAAKVAHRVGFRYQIRLVRDGLYGELMENGSWNGIIGELTRREADMAIAPLTINAERTKFVDFSKPFMDLGISIMIKKPEKQKPGVFSFMEPLSWSIWYCIVSCYLGVSVVLFVVSRFSPNEWQIEEKSYSGKLGYANDFTLSNSLWFSLGAFMRRGCDVCPRSLSGRLVGSAWWFFTLIIISSYTANLAAFLTIERMLVPINGPEDLAKQKEILYGTVMAGSTREFFKTSKLPTYQLMWAFMNTSPSLFERTTESGVSRVRKSKGKYAFLMESTMNDYYNQRKPCNTMKVGSNLDSKGYGIGTYIGSDLREKINVAVLELMENEVLQKLQKKWWYDKGECEVESKSGSSQSSLSLSNVAGIFFILIGGLGLSLLVATVEFVVKSHRDRRKKFFLSNPFSLLPNIEKTTLHLPFTHAYHFSTDSPLTLENKHNTLTNFFDGCNDTKPRRPNRITNEVSDDNRNKENKGSDTDRTMEPGHYTTLHNDPSPQKGRNIIGSFINNILTKQAKHNNTTHNITSFGRFWKEKNLHQSSHTPPLYADVKKHFMNGEKKYVKDKIENISKNRGFHEGFYDADAGGVRDVCDERDVGGGDRRVDYDDGGGGRSGDEDDSELMSDNKECYDDDDVIDDDDHYDVSSDFSSLKAQPHTLV